MKRHEISRLNISNQARSLWNSLKSLAINFKRSNCCPNLQLTVQGIDFSRFHGASFFHVSFFNVFLCVKMRLWTFQFQKISRVRYPTLVREGWCEPLNPDPPVARPAPRMLGPHTINTTTNRPITGRRMAAIVCLWEAQIPLRKDRFHFFPWRPKFR